MLCSFPPDLQCFVDSKKNREKQIPINIASTIAYKDNKFKHVTNLDQARQYLGLASKYSIDTNNNDNNDDDTIDFTKDFEELKNE